MDKYFLAVDPGREKTGLAILNRQAQILFLSSISLGHLAEVASKLAQDYQFEKILLGDGTGKELARNKLEQILPEKNILLVDETNTTLLAKDLYWQINPPQGFKKLLPRSLLAICEPLDGYAAAVIGKKWLAEKTD